MNKDVWSSPIIGPTHRKYKGEQNKFGDLAQKLLETHKNNLPKAHQCSGKDATLAELAILNY